MSEFLDVLISQDFMQNAIIIGLLASVACGVMGSYVVVRRIVFISGGISHTVLGGMGIAYYYGYNPLHGAVISALIAALVIGFVSLRYHQYEDTLIGALWAVGMAVGILFIYKTPGYNVDLMSYLFGNILMVEKESVRLLAYLDGLIILSVLLFYKRFLAVCFDEEYSKLQGVGVVSTYLLLLCLIALTVVILIQVVGIILVIALLTLPAATARYYARSLVQMMIIASILGALFTTSGLIVSYQPNLPAGATIVVIAGLAYLLATVLKGLAVRFHGRRD
ncbi:MAG: metal ABC transporter permease [Deltaproteobacteria bacterium]|nr:metal ABC transporter permease [Deltaproteobacteria bacterium]MBW2567262.1 metal ABC transporter permease [Deltaproteobacteria bacterium]